MIQTQTSIGDITFTVNMLLLLLLAIKKAAIGDLGSNYVFQGI
jgi:hypothetical protein